MTHEHALIESFREIARTHALWDHPFLRRCRDGQLQPFEVRTLAVQMYRFSQEFASILARILARCPDEAARVVIAENLFEELGEGSQDRTHAELFRRFTRALGVRDEALGRAPTEPETRQLIDTYLSLPERHGWVPALAAVCFASEGIVSTLYRQLQQGIAGAVDLDDDALAFFEVHVNVDTGHAAKLAAVVGPRIDGPELAERARAAIREALDARVRFFSGVQGRAGRIASRPIHLTITQEVNVQ